MQRLCQIRVIIILPVIRRSTGGQATRVKRHLTSVLMSDLPTSTHCAEGLPATVRYRLVLPGETSTVVKGGEPRLIVV